MKRDEFLAKLKEKTMEVVSDYRQYMDGETPIEIMADMAVITSRATAIAVIDMLGEVGVIKFDE